MHSLCDADTVSCDRFKIAQVIRNFLSNAIKFTPRGGTVTVSACFVADCAANTGTRGSTARGNGSGRNFAKPVRAAASSLKGMSVRRLVHCATDVQSAAVVDIETGRVGDSAREGRGEDTAAAAAALAAEASSGFLKITVKDSGAGLNEDDQKKLFKQVVQFRYDSDTNSTQHIATTTADRQWKI
jgi:signal transduction histidine kinase